MALLRCTCLWDDHQDARTAPDPTCPAHPQESVMATIPCNCHRPGVHCYAHPDGPVCTCIRSGEQGDTTHPVLIPDPDCRQCGAPTP